MAWRYFIRPEQCRACTACLKVCPEDAIVVTELRADEPRVRPGVRERYEIDQGRCTRCGACMRACKLRVIQRKFSLR